MIIFFFGKDEFQSSRKLAEIKNKFLEKNKEGGTLFVFDFAEGNINPNEVAIKLSSGGLFSNKRLAIFKNALADKKMIESEPVLELLKRMNKEKLEDLAVIFWEKEKFEKKSKLAKFLVKNAKSQEFAFLEGARLTSWIKEELKTKSGGRVGIVPAASQKLAAFIGSDNLYLLEKEIEKLASHKEKGDISEADVDQLVRAKISAEIFKTIDALASGDKKTALKMLHDHLSAGDDPFYILSMYFYQFRNLLKVKSLAVRHIPEREIAPKLKLHPFVVKKSLAQCGNFSLAKLKEIYRSLCEADFRIKTGKTEIGLALDKFVAAI